MGSKATVKYKFTAQCKGRFLTCVSVESKITPRTFSRPFFLYDNFRFFSSLHSAHVPWPPPTLIHTHFGYFSVPQWSGAVSRLALGYRGPFTQINQFPRSHSVLLSWITLKLKACEESTADRRVKVSSILPFRRFNCTHPLPVEMLALNPGCAQHFSGGEVLHSSGRESLSSNPNSAPEYDPGHITSSLKISIRHL